MDDMSAFDRQIASEVLLGAGPSEPVDDLAIFEAVIDASRSHSWGFTMFSALKFVAAAAIVALFGGFLLTGILTAPQADEVVPAAVTESPSLLPAAETDFPIGTFVAVENPDRALQFREDGTGKYFTPGRWSVDLTYGVAGDRYTELTYEQVGPDDGPWGPATYTWDFDGEQLTFEPAGEDLMAYRESVYAGNRWRLVDDPREVLVARADLPAGSTVYARLRVVPGAEAGPDALRDPQDVVNRVAAVAIAKGQAITRDMLELAAE